MAVIRLKNRISKYLKEKIEFLGWKLETVRGSLEWDWGLISGFLDYGQNLFQFFEVFQHGYASLGDGVD